MFTIDQIKQVTFTEKKGGYMAQEVDDFIDGVLETLEAANAENLANRGKLDTLASKLVEYRNKEDSINASIVKAQTISDSMIKEAEEKVSAMIAEAEEKASSMVADAEQKANALMEDATSKSNTLISDAQEQSSTMIREANEQAEATTSSAQNRSDALLAETEEKVAKMQADADKDIKDKLAELEKETIYRENCIAELTNAAVDFKEKLFGIYEEHSKVINQLPSKRIDMKTYVEPVVEEPAPVVEPAVTDLNDEVADSFVSPVYEIPDEPVNEVADFGAPEENSFDFTTSEEDSSEVVEDVFDFGASDTEDVQEGNESDAFDFTSPVADAFNETSLDFTTPEIPDAEISFDAPAVEEEPTFSFETPSEDENATEEATFDFGGSVSDISFDSIGTDTLGDGLEFGTSSFDPDENTDISFGPAFGEENEGSDISFGPAFGADSDNDLSVDAFDFKLDDIEDIDLPKSDDLLWPEEDSPKSDFSDLQFGDDVDTGAAFNPFGASDN